MVADDFSAGGAQGWAGDGAEALFDLSSDGDAGPQDANGDPISYDRFSPRVAEALGRYVYRLVDPRNEETFYVGRGVGNRVFDHMDEAEDVRFGGGGGAKTARINAIHAEGLKVRTVIHRHNLRDDAETATLEAAMIQAYDGLTNQVAGAGTTAFGARPSDAVIADYDLPPADFRGEKILLLAITTRWPRAEADAPVAWSDIYDRTRYGWSLDVKRARRARYIVAHARGLVRGVFEAEAWLEAENPIFAAFPRAERGRCWGFIGCPADRGAHLRWVDRRMPDRYRERFGQKVRYAGV